MKTLNIFIFCLLLVSCNKEQVTIPIAVQDAFEIKYPNEINLYWEIDANNNFEAHFKKQGKKYRADFSPQGLWIETENSIKLKQLPKAIRDVIKTEYNNEHITEIEHVMSHEKGEFYDVEFKRKGKNHDIEFRFDGSIIK